MFPGYVYTTLPQTGPSGWSGEQAWPSRHCCISAWEVKTVIVFVCRILSATQNPTTTYSDAASARLLLQLPTRDVFCCKLCAYMNTPIRSSASYAAQGANVVFYCRATDVVYSLTSVVWRYHTSAIVRATAVISLQKLNGTIISSGLG